MSATNGNTDDTAQLYDLLTKSTHRTVLKKHLTENVYKALHDKRTSYGGTLGDCMRSGVLVESSWFGVFAPDPDAYKTFKVFFDSVILDYHGLEEINHPGCDFGDLDNLGFSDLDPSRKYVESTRVRIGRSVKGYRYNPQITLKERKEIEEKMVFAFSQLPEGIKGEYYPLESLSPAKTQELVDQHYLFNLGNKKLEANGGYKDWPKARGIYYNADKTFVAWLNEEDHVRLISMQNGGNLGEVYRRLVTAVKTIQEKGNVQFETLPKYGFITACPSNIGTTLRAGVHVRIPNMHAKNTKGADYVIAFCKKYNLQARSARGDPYPAGDTEVYDLSNEHRMGLTEIQAVREMQKGVEAIINHEKSLES